MPPPLSAFPNRPTKKLIAVSVVSLAPLDLKNLHHARTNYTHYIFSLPPSAISVFFLFFLHVDNTS